jgi:hypothetical protein
MRELAVRVPSIFLSIKQKTINMKLSKYLFFFGMFLFSASLALAQY